MTRWFLAVALCASPHAFAQVAEFSVSGGTSRLSNNDIGSLSTTGGSASDVQLKGGFRLGFRLTLNNWRFFGHEFGYAYNRTQFRFGGADYGTSIHQGFYDFLVYATPEGSAVRPFAAGGGQFSNFIFPGGSVTQGGGSTKFGFNYGGGIKVRVHHMFNIRLDLRQYQSGKPFDLPLASGLIRQTEISAGFGFVL